MNMRRTSSESDEYEIALVTEFFEKKGLQVERIKHSGKKGKIPDLRLLSDIRPVALCEVKARHDESEERKFDHISPEEARGLFQPKDPAYNRFANLIEKAHGQLSSYDPEHNLLRFVAFVDYGNWRDPTNFELNNSGIGDLDIILTGEIQTINGPIPVMKSFSEGRLGKIKHEIDAYLWFRACDKYFGGGFLTHDKDRNIQARRLLGFIS